MGISIVILETCLLLVPVLSSGICLIIIFVNFTLANPSHGELYLLIPWR